MTYNTASFPHLIKTLTSLLNPANQTHDKPSAPARAPLLLLAYKERDASERELWDLAKQHGIWMELVDVITGHEGDRPSEEGAGGGATEIWIGGMGEKAQERSV